MRIGPIGTVETGTEGTIETGAEGMVEMGATGAAGEMVVGISVSTTTFSSSKVFATTRMGIQNKRRPQQRG